MPEQQEPHKRLEARLAFARQENVLHDQLMALNSDVAAARQRNLSPEQWEAALAYFVEMCDAVARFRARWREIVGPET